MRRSRRYAVRFDALDGPLRSRTRRRSPRARPRRRRRCDLRLRPRPGTSRASRARSCRARSASLSRRASPSSSACGRSTGWAVRAGWPVSAPLVAPDDGHPRTRGRRPRDRCRLSTAGRGGAGSRCGGGRDAPVPPRRRARHSRPGVRHPDGPRVSTGSSAREQVRRGRQVLCRARLCDRLPGRPSEILILSDGGNPAWLAADLIAQAEHDPDARAILITSKARLARAVAREVVRADARHAARPRSPSATTAASSSRARPQKRSRWPTAWRPSTWSWTRPGRPTAVRCAGAIFIGGHTAQVAGDYAIGSNHVLPTGGAARFRGGLSAADFVRTVSVQRVTARGLRSSGTIGRGAGAGRRTDRARAIHPGEGAMIGEYERPTAAPGGLRLHLNENTGRLLPPRARGDAGSDRRRHRVLSRLRRRCNARRLRISVCHASRCCS